MFSLRGIESNKSKKKLTLGHSVAIVVNRKTLFAICQDEVATGRSNSGLSFSPTEGVDYLDGKPLASSNGHK